MFSLFCVFAFGIPFLSDNISGAESESFVSYFGVTHFPGASEQYQMHQTVLKGLMKFRSDYREAMARERAVEMELELIRSAIGRGRHALLTEQEKRMEELLNERILLAVERKKRVSLFYDACSIAQKKSFGKAAKLAVCEGAPSVDVVALAGEVHELRVQQQ